MKAKSVSEQLHFNFEEPPYKRYASRRGVSRPPVQNPNKGGYGGGLSPEEEEIIERHQFKIQEVQEEVDLLEIQIEDLQGELYNLEMTSPVGESELEQFYADIQIRHGDKALDIMNSGISKKDKINSIDRLSPGKDFGIREYEDLVQEYEYYHQEDPDPEEVESLNAEIAKLKRQKDERENTIEKLQNKIYNLENY